MLGKRIINTATAAACTTDTVQILGDTSCIAYYKMSDATDETGSYDGTPTNVNFNVAGKFGNAGSFNGSSSRISLPTSTFNTLTSYTISTWIYLTSTLDAQTIFTNYDIVSGSTRGVGFRYRQAASNIEVFNLLSSSVTGVFSTNSIPQNTWTNLTVTNTQSEIKIYINGSLDSSHSTGGFNSYSDSSTDIGALTSRVPEQEQYFNGSIDQVRIFNRAITATEVETLYNEVQCIPTIVPTDYFEPVIYTGNGSAQSITSLDFQPDLVWWKNRDITAWHQLHDSVRGAGNRIFSNDTSGTQFDAQSIKSFDTNGFTIGTSSDFTGDCVAWNFKAGGTAVSNTDGTITSQVSANTDAGFSIVKYTGNGVSNATIGHGLSSAPEFVIIKSTSDAYNWFSYHKGSRIGQSGNPEDGYMILNTTGNDNPANSPLMFNSVAPSSTVLNLASYTEVNGPSKQFISYCFHSVDGYSKIGSYTGTGADGNSIVTGFRPAFVMIKKTSGTGDWFMHDNKRLSPSGFSDLYLSANLSAAEINSGDDDLLKFNSNGFTLNTIFGDYNASGASYIFMAFAEEAYNPNGVTRNDTDPFGDASELALYKFEDNANDAEGSYNGTASNVTYATGYIDKAAVFNGSSSYIQATTGNNDIITSSSYTVSVWITQNTNDTQYRTFFGQQASNGKGIYIGKENTGTTFRCVGNTTNKITLSTNYSHLVVVADSLTNTVKWYLNGALVDSTSGLVFNPSTAAINGTGVRIGQQIGTTFAEFWNGNLDQVRIFDRALDAGEVTQLYNE